MGSVRRSSHSYARDTSDILRRARATTAAPKIFKPFHHEATKQVYLDGGIYYNNPVKVADRERKLIWPSLRDSSPDLVVSLGTAMKRGNHQQVRDIPTSKVPRLGVDSHLSSLLKIAQDHIAASLNSEETWKDFVGTIANRSAERSKLIRINPELPHDPPNLDDVPAMNRLKEEVDAMTFGDRKIRRLALQLLATMFYFEVIEFSDVGSTRPIVKGQITFRTSSIPRKSQSTEAAVKKRLDPILLMRHVGYIRCRLPKGSIYSNGLAFNLRRKSCDGNPSFVVQEQGLGHETGRYVQLTSHDLVNMARFQQYCSKLISVPLSSHKAVLEVMLEFAPERRFMISGLPRVMTQEKIVPESKSSATTLRLAKTDPSRKTQWRANAHWTSFWLSIALASNSADA